MPYMCTVQMAEYRVVLCIKRRLCLHLWFGTLMPSKWFLIKIMELLDSLLSVNALSLPLI